MKTGAAYVIVAVILLAGFLFLAFRALSPGLLGYDEADYAFDAGLGWGANYTDTPTLPIQDFLKEGLGRGKSASERGPLSESIRNSNDVIFYRHWHGPLYFYWLIPSLGITHDERSLRSLGLGIPMLSFAVITIGCLWLAGWMEAILGAALFVLSWTTLGSTELAPHQLFVFCYLVSLFSLAAMMRTGQRRFLYLSVFAAALAFCTLEVAFVLIATILVCTWLKRRELGLDWETVLRAAGLFVGTVFVLWPAALLKLSFVKAYLFMAYLAVFRKSPWGNEGLASTWAQRFANSPVEWIVIAAALAIFFASREMRARRMLYPFLIFAALMIAATLRVTTGTPRYALPFMPALQVFAGLVVGDMLRRRAPRMVAYSVAALTVAGLFANAWVAVDRHRPGTDPQLASMLDAVRRDHLENAALLVPQGYLPAIHYYFPHTRLRGYFGEHPTAEESDGGGYRQLLK